MQIYMREVEKGFHILFFVKVMIAEPHNAIILFRSVTMLCGVENKL